MTAAIISIPGAEPLAVLDARGWRKGSYGDEDEGSGPVCLHGAIRLCQPVPGDGQIVEAVAARQGWGTAWNDHPGTDEKMVRALLAKGIEITDDDLHATFGCQWEAVLWIVRRAAVLTDDAIDALGDVAAAARSDEWDAARDAARAAARAAARYAAWAAARGAALSAARDAEWDAARDAAWGAVACGAVCAAVWDLASEAGRFTFEHRDLLVGPWETVIGLPPTLTRSSTP